MLGVSGAYVLWPLAAIVLDPEQDLRKGSAEGFVVSRQVEAAFLKEESSESKQLKEIKDEERLKEEERGRAGGMI